MTTKEPTVLPMGSALSRIEAIYQLFVEDRYRIQPVPGTALLAWRSVQETDPRAVEAAAAMTTARTRQRAGLFADAGYVVIDVLVGAWDAADLLATVNAAVEQQDVADWRIAALLERARGQRESADGLMEMASRYSTQATANEALARDLIARRAGLDQFAVYLSAHETAA